MGPAKVSPAINKIRIKGYEHQQHHQDPPSTSSTKKRKITFLGPTWSTDELMRFYEAYHSHGKDWKKISTAVGHKSSDMVKDLYKMHQTFLSLPKHQSTAMGFIALVTGHHNDETVKSSGNQTVSVSGKAKKRGEAAPQKVSEAPYPYDSSKTGTIPGFSPSFKKRYYGELARNTQSHAVGNRTPRVPLIVRTDRNVTDDATAGLKSTNSSTKRDSELIANDCVNFPMNNCSLDGRSAITESTKGVEVQTFLETKGTGDAETCQVHQPLKKRRINQTVDGDQTSNIEHGTMMAVEERDTSVSLPNAEHILSEFISSADDMLILDVLHILVDSPDKMSIFKINIPSDTPRKSDSTLSDRKDQEHSPVDLSKQGKPVGESSVSTTKERKYTELLEAEVPSEETNVANAIDITEGPSNPDSTRGIGDLPESTVNISLEAYPNAQKKIDPEISISRRRKIKFKMHSNKKYVSCNEVSDNLQAKKLLRCLSSELVRRWCTYEWFYSAVDFPWFMDYEFAKYLNHPYLRHILKLARFEWNIVPSSQLGTPWKLYRGKPRRFSDNFLVAEREQLESHRKMAREYYAQLSDGSLDSLPAHLARPFFIGHKIIVRHPSSMELSDGKVLMVQQDCYQVQFDNPELGTDIVKDTDCTPVNWLDNLPDTVRSSFVSSNVHSIPEMEQIMELRPSDNRDHTINGVSTSELPNSLGIASDEQLEVLFCPNSHPRFENKIVMKAQAEHSVDSERTQKKSLSDGTVQPRYFPDNFDSYNDQLESHCCAFVQSLQSQAWARVDEVMLAISGGNDCQDEEAGAANCRGPESVGAAIRYAQLPSDLITNCTATVLAIKRLADSRHPPANITGVLECFASMLRPSCSDNLAIYREIERHIAVIASQIVATSMFPM